MEAFGNGSFDVSGWTSEANAVGSIEGSGAIFLGPYNLSVGGNNLNTTFAGILQDGGYYNTGGPGSMTKVGSGTLTLSGANIYTGGTTVNGGTLLVRNTVGSGTGTANVAVPAGALGGTGFVGGGVTLGPSSGSGAFLSPGNNGTGNLTIKKSLAFKSATTYQCELDTSRIVADRVTAKGVTIGNGATFSLIPLGSSTLSVNTTFTVINNTAVTPIRGTFSNLTDGTTLIMGNNKFQASYEGGTGNDLTLTVVP